MCVRPIRETVGMATASEPGIRERNRIERTRIFLSTALNIVTGEGFDALTMQRLADECDAAIGAVYRYFPSKGALVAEVQREAVERLFASSQIIRSRGAQQIVLDDLDEISAALARLVLFGRFFVSTADSFPQELRLLQMLMNESHAVMSPEDGLRVIPSAMRLLDQLRSELDVAAAAGALDHADTMGRVITWAAAVSGVLQVSRLHIYDAELFDGDRLARMLTLDLLSAWGATADGLTAATEFVDRLAAVGPLAPALPE